MAKMDIVDIQARLVGLTNAQVALLAAAARDGQERSTTTISVAEKFKTWLDEQDQN